MAEKGEPERFPAASADTADAIAAEEQPPTVAHTPRFWIIIAALSSLAFISALDVTAIPPALPTIIEEIGGSTQYVWIANSFVFASSVLQPLVGQLANILGRKIPMVSSIVLFIVGSGIAGGAINAAMLISGRTVQGVGAGGIYVLIDIVCCDLVPLRDRSKYLGIVNAWAGVAAGLGPVFGGLLAEPYDETAPIEAMQKAQDQITRDFLPRLEELTPGGGAYLNEGDFQQPGWQQVFYGSNYGELNTIKDRYDPFHLFYAVTAVGSEYWTPQQDGKLCKA